MKTNFKALGNAWAVVLLIATLFVACKKSSKPAFEAIASVADAKENPARLVSESVRAPTITDVVALVKSATLPGYENSTVGEAFEATFQDPKWNALTQNGTERTVEFRGTVNYTAFRDAGFYIGNWNGVRQGIEFERVTAIQRKLCLEQAGQQVEPTSIDDSKIGPCMHKANEKTVIPVSFQFTISPDGKNIQIAAMDAVFQKFGTDHRLSAHRDVTLAFIYK